MHLTRFLLLAAVVASSSVAAAPYCPGGATDAPSNVKQAVDKWEGANSIKVARPVKDTATKEFCNAASSVINDKLADANAVDRVTVDVMSDYLDRQSGKVGKPRSMSASMRESLGTAGLSKPEFQRFVAINFTFTKPVDGLMVDEDHYARQSRMLVPVGKHLVKALQGAAVLCSESLDAKAGIESAFGC